MIVGVPGVSLMALQELRSILNERASGLLDTPIAGSGMHGNGNLTATEEHAAQNIAS